MRALVRMSASVWKLRIMGASLAQRPDTRKRYVARNLRETDTTQASDEVFH